LYVLLTNDDGINAPGLLALKKAMERIGEVAVVAPDHNWSAAGHAKTMHKPLRVNEVTLQDGSRAYATTGAPSDCVALAVLSLLDRKPDLVVSGINRGWNLGCDMTYSGTVTAAMEGVIFGIRSIAVSIDMREELDFSYAARVAADLAARLVDGDLPEATLLNINVPALPESQIRGIYVTRLGRRIYRDLVVKRQDPFGRNYYWIGGEPPEGVMEEGTDVWAVANGYVSVTPIHLDMTDYQMLERLKSWGTNAEQPDGSARQQT
jgi:5'-nucleotidase